MKNNKLMFSDKNPEDVININAFDYCDDQMEEMFEKLDLIDNGVDKVFSSDNQNKSTTIKRSKDRLGYLEVSLEKNSTESTPENQIPERVSSWDRKTSQWNVIFPKELKKCQTCGFYESHCVCNMHNSLH